MVWFEKGFSIRALAYRGLGAASYPPLSFEPVMS